MLIGLYGPAKAGKSSVAKYLVENHNFMEFTFASALKKIVKSVFGLTSHQVGSQDGKETIDPIYRKTPRTIMQTMGSAIREIDPEFFISKLFVDERFGKCGSGIWRIHAVVSDLRFPNEIAAVLNDGGFVIQITKVGGAALSGTEAAHESEQILDLKEAMKDNAKVFFVSAPDGDLENLFQQVGAIVSKLPERK